MQKKGKNRHITLEMVYDMENLKLADKIARRGKTNNYGVRKFDKDREKNLLKLQEEIKNGTFETPKPKIELQRCDNNKVRSLSKVHYYYHVAHHALMNVIMPIINRSYYYESSASIENRGIHYSVKHIRKYLDLNKNKDLWWTQIDFIKFYHNIKRDRIFSDLCKTFTNPGIRWMLRDIIWSLRDENGLGKSDGNTGMGIGLYPVQPLVNFYLNKLDRRISAIPGIKMYRYCDNILLIGTSPEVVWQAINLILDFAKNELDQPVHTNIGVQKLDDVHPIDFIGYKFYKTYTWIRDSIKYKFKQKMKVLKNDPEKLERVLAAYKGWLMHCSGLSLWKHVTGMNKFSELGLGQNKVTLDKNGKRIFDARYVPMYSLVGRELEILDFEEGCTTANGNRTFIKARDVKDNEQIKFCTANDKMVSILKEAKEKLLLPFSTKIEQLRRNNSPKIEYYFT